MIVVASINKDLEQRFTPAILDVIRWVFRAAVVFFVLELILRVTRNFKFDIFPVLLSLWGALRCGQGLYLSGVEDGLTAGRRAKRYSDDGDT